MNPDRPSDAAEQAAVAAVRAELATLPVPPVPPEYAARWAAALGAESGAKVAAVRSGGGRRRITRRAPSGPPGRRPRSRVRPAPLALVALTMVMAVAALWPRTPAVAELDGIGLASAGLAAVGSTDAGALADPHRRADCLRAVAVPGADPAAALLGGQQVVVHGRPGVLLVLATGERGRFRVVVVDPDCGPAGGTLLTSTTVGGS